jgi:hypothetical protein
MIDMKILNMRLCGDLPYAIAYILGMDSRYVEQKAVEMMELARESEELLKCLECYKTVERALIGHVSSENAGRDAAMIVRRMINQNLEQSKR